MKGSAVVECVYETDRKVYANERHVVRAFDEAPEGVVPEWILRVRASSKRDDHSKKDVLFDTDVGTLYCQVKSRNHDRDMFLEWLDEEAKDPLERLRYFCIVAREGFTLQEICEDVVAILSERRAFECARRAAHAEV